MKRPTLQSSLRSQVHRSIQAWCSSGLIGAAVAMAIATPRAVRAQGWQQAPAVPTDMRNTLATISKDSKLFQIYQLYRENRDGLQKSAERISLAEAIQRGLATSPILAATVSEIQASEWNSIAVGREWVPSLTIRTTDPGVLGYSTRTTSYQYKKDASAPVDNTLYSHGFTTNPYANLSWSIFDPSRVVRQSALSSVSNSLRNRLSFSTRELILAIQSAYTNLQDALEREKDTIELFNQSVHVYIGAHKARRPAGEVSRLEAQSVSLLISRVNAHKQSIQAADVLARLINLKPGQLAMPSEKPELLPSWTMSRMDSIQRALRLREELQANAWDVKALESDARAIRLRVLPALALSSQIKRVGGNVIAGTLTGGQSGTLTRTSGYESFLGLTFDWKVFDGGIRNAEANAKDAKARQSMANGVQTRLEIGQQVEDAYATYVASKILVDAAKADVSASRQSLEGALKDYASGRHDDAGTTVVQALSKLQSALSNYRDLVTEQNLAIHQLYRYTASWPERTEQLVTRQYQRWLPSATLPLSPRQKIRVPDAPSALQIDTVPSSLSQPGARP